MPEGTDDNTQKKQSLKKILNGLKDGFEDLTTVQVLTFTGDIDQVLDKKQNEDRTIKWDDLRKLKGELMGKVELAAATQIDLDYDIVNFRATSLDEDLRKLHDEAVKTSLESRRAFLEMFTSTLLG